MADNISWKSIPVGPLYGQHFLLIITNCFIFRTQKKLQWQLFDSADLSGFGIPTVIQSVRLRVHGCCQECFLKTTYQNGSQQCMASSVARKCMSLQSWIKGLNEMQCIPIQLNIYRQINVLSCRTCKRKLVCFLAAYFYKK